MVDGWKKAQVGGGFDQVDIFGGRNSRNLL